MADSCCESKSGELAALHSRQSQVLWIVLAVNATLFVVEFVAGWIARSTALLGDSLDMLGDAFVYALSLWALRRGPRWKAKAALSKGYIQLGFGVFVLGQAGWKVITGVGVDAETMGAIGVVALLGNLWCFRLLWQHRSDDLNMRSTWLCSRNDLIANSAVIVAAGLAWWTGSGWPDVFVGVSIAAIFLKTAVGIIAEARRELASIEASEPMPAAVPR